MARTIKETFAMSRREIMNDPQFDWARNRAARRWLCAAYGALAVIGGVLLGLGTADRSIWFIGGVVLTLPVFVFLIGSINASVRGLTEIRTTELDEWQIARRDAMFRLCWWPAVVLLGIVGYVGAMTAIAPGIKAGLGFAAFFLAMYLPTLALAWTYPDDPEP